MKNFRRIPQLCDLSRARSAARRRGPREGSFSLPGKLNVLKLPRRGLSAGLLHQLDRRHHAEQCGFDAPPPLARAVRAVMAAGFAVAGAVLLAEQLDRVGGAVDGRIGVLGGAGAVLGRPAGQRPADPADPHPGRGAGDAPADDPVFAGDGDLLLVGRIRGRRGRLHGDQQEGREHGQG